MGEIDIALDFCFKNAFGIRNDVRYLIEIKSTCKQLQNETNPSSVAPFVKKWCSTEGETVSL